MEKVIEIFHPHYCTKRKEVEKNGTRFAHYTSVEAAKNIIEKKQVWLRKTACMNDTRETIHGKKIIEEILKTNPSSFLEAIGKISTISINSIIGDLYPILKNETYVTCFCEHRPEDNRGLLSMWRGYGRKSAVAFIFKTDVMFIEHPNLNVFASPVAYFQKDKFTEQMECISKNVLKELPYLKSLDKSFLTFAITNFLAFAMTSSKDPAFDEEKEWRIMHLPHTGDSPFVKKEVEIIDGIPQIILKLPLVAKDKADLQLDTLLDKIIVGPTSFDDVTREAFVHLLKQAGVSSPEKKVVYCNIPLRN